MKYKPLYGAYKRMQDLNRSSNKAIKDLDQLLWGSNRADDKYEGILANLHRYNSLFSRFFFELYKDKIDFSDEMKDFNEYLNRNFLSLATLKTPNMTDEQKNTLDDFNLLPFGRLHSAINDIITRNHTRNKSQKRIKFPDEMKDFNDYFKIDQTKNIEELENFLSYIENSDNFGVTCPKWENGMKVDVDDIELGPERLSEWKISTFSDKVKDFENDLEDKVTEYISKSVNLNEQYTREIIRKDIDDIDWENLRQNKSISDVSNNEHDKKFAKLYEGNLNKFVKIYSNFISHIGDEIGIDSDAINSELGKVVFDSNDITRHLRNIETHDKFSKNGKPIYISGKILDKFENEFKDDIISLYKSDSKKEVSDFIRDIFMNRKYDTDGFSLVDGQIIGFDFTNIIPYSNEGLVNRQSGIYTDNLSTMLEVMDRDSREYRRELKNLFEYKNLLDTYIDKTYNLDQNNIINELFVQSDWIDLKKDGKPDSKACSENLKNRFKEKNHEMQTAVGTQLNKVLGYES